MKILVSGLLNIETTVPVREFPINYYPIDYPFFGISSNVSGVGYNIAKALTTLGNNVNLISFLGKDDEADRILNRLHKDGINAENIRQDLKNTPASVILYDPQGKRQIYCDLKDIQEQNIGPNAVTDDLKDCDAVVLCNINFNRELIKRVRSLGVTTATDVHVLSDINDEYNRDFMANADILFLSDEALPCAAEDFIRQIKNRYHNKIIVIGMGSKGAMLLDAEKNEVSVISAYSNGNIVNTVGAGDALFSSFLHFYIKGCDAKSALQRAVVFAGIKIGYNGASVGFSTEQDINNKVKDFA
ncbi:MAG: carbohydrate kinase family protein [Ruminococcus sp.]|nr:carbohydrate kinase family protein [Ruminococcus sp.]